MRAIVRSAFVVVVLASCVRSREAPLQTSSVTCPRQPALAVAPADSGPSLQLAANPLISRNKRVVGWSAARWSDPRRAVDGDYGTSWDAGRPTASAPAWVAIDVGVGPKRVLLAWSADGSYNYVETTYGSPGAYHIDVSSDSTDGADGTWQTVASVSNVTTHARAHAFDFAGRRWVKFVVTAVPSLSPNGVQIGEIDVHDASTGCSDTWFFMGDSITAAAFNRAHVRQGSFATCVHGRHASYYPMMINGGVGYSRSADGVAHVDDWMALNPDAHFWAIGYGSNDAAGNASDTSEFRANMEKIVSRLLAAGRVPILTTIPYSTDGQHTNIPSFNRVIDEIRAERSLPNGPDLYAWFSAHPDELLDGLHPNDRGAASMNRLWADAVDSIYPR